MKTLTKKDIIKLSRTRTIVIQKPKVESNKGDKLYKRDRNKNWKKEIY